MVCDILECMFCSSIILYLCRGSLWWNCGVGWLRAHTVEHGLLLYFLWGPEGFHVSFSKGKVHVVIIILLYLDLHCRLIVASYVLHISFMSCFKWHYVNCTFSNDNHLKRVHMDIRAETGMGCFSHKVDSVNGKV